jgi:ferredoxin-fold anticodon binding domain-containing protein
MQIGELLKSNRGLCEEELEEWIKENEEKKVYELLVIKKELSESREYRDVSVMRWFRG